MKTDNTSATVSTVLLDWLIKHGSREAIRQLALMHLKGMGILRNEKYGRPLLLVAAFNGDRGASWLLSGYYLTGSYGFEKNMEKFDYWRKRTEKRLWSDAHLEYIDPTDKRIAIHRYEIWRRQVEKWQEYKTPLDLTQGEAAGTDGRALV